MLKSKIFFFFISYILLSSIISGQIIKSYGIKTGFSSAWQSYIANGEDYSDAFDKKNGFALYLSSTWIDNSIFNLNSEIGFTQKGRILETIITNGEHPNGTGESVIDDFSFNYLSIIVYPEVFYNFNNIKAYIFIGPRLDVELSRDAKTEAPKEFLEYNSRINKKLLEEYKKVQFGVTTAIGLQISNLLPFNFGFEVRYNPDISKIYRNNNVYSRNNSLDFLLTIKL